MRSQEAYALAATINGDFPDWEEVKALVYGEDEDEEEAEEETP